MEQDTKVRVSVRQWTSTEDGGNRGYVVTCDTCGELFGGTAFASRVEADVVASEHGDKHEAGDELQDVEAGCPACGAFAGSACALDCPIDGELPDDDHGPGCDGPYNCTCEQPSEPTDDCPTHGADRRIEAFGQTAGADPYATHTLDCGCTVASFGPGDENVVLRTTAPDPEPLTLRLRCTMHGCDLQTGDDEDVQALMRNANGSWTVDLSEFWCPVEDIDDAGDSVCRHRNGAWLVEVAR